MPEITDLIAPPLNKCSSFVVNASGAVDSVLTSTPAGNKIATNAFVESKFKAGDSFRLLSLGLVVQDAFTLFKDAAVTPFPSMSIEPYGVTSAQLYIYPGFSSGLQFICMENYEQVSDLFFPCRNAYGAVDPTKTLLSEDFQLSIGLTNEYKISMIGVPLAFDGKTMYIVPFVKVSHSLPMVV
jgi:hypothetical protein